jgi:excisionase family DNA binding protein
MQNFQQTPVDPLLTIAEVAEELRVSVFTVRRIIGRSELRAIAITPRRHVIRRSELNRYRHARETRC